jgi:hypothetical protein
MSAAPEYDEEAYMQATVVRMHEEWEEMRAHLTSGQKAWLTQTLNYCDRMMQADPKAALKLLARYEFIASMQNKHGEPRPNKNAEYLSDYIDYVPANPAAPSTSPAARNKS